MRVEFGVLQSWPTVRSGAAMSPSCREGEWCRVVRQLQANLAAARLRLTAEDVEELDRATTQKQLYPHSYNARVLDQAQQQALAG